MQQNTQPLNILMVAAEIVPFVKVGGLADVVGALPKALKALGHDVRLVMPRYRQVDPERFHLTKVLSAVPVSMGDYQVQVDVLQGTIGENVPVYMIDAPRYFERENIYGYTDDGERFILFCRAALEVVRALAWPPDIIHCNDWHTGIIPNWMQTVYQDDPFFQNTATVYTIHNLAYQGIFGYRLLEVAGVAENGFLYPHITELANVVDVMGRGILFADVITTVSERYAQEILTPAFGEKLDHLLRSRKERVFGILNGIDYQEFDPAIDRYIHTNFDAHSLDKRVENKADLQEHAHLPVRPDIPLLGMISRLADQKGFDILAQIMQPLLAQGVQFVVLGIGDQKYHELFQNLAARYPDQVAIFLTFNSELAQRIYAGSDMFLMPSRFEPCGLSQMIAMRYGSVPIVRYVGGLADTVPEYNPETEEGTGFVFHDYDPWALFASIIRATTVYRLKDEWRKLQLRGMDADHSWHRSAIRYVEVYRKALEFHQRDMNPL
ncbi:starch synthase [Thermosporothrix hazakensis]|jgi:starch synthase|uniref:Glycogen synthase n=2 Tax=Thermosporothrix TaxID=768650 RepID=A0A326ULN2_THEHA|nr:glycogen synthase GlgA [Thermosporothrix hazakensis]PZW30594.1 starch synthase [Thermosporothrix hazakensis]BBH91309.1 glycogen synthase [Thermosporothrix sp. COM3]GCE49456.1 glycogen synthase [Thermosporothrix hazakensis]